MHGLGFNRFAAKYLDRVKVDCSGILPQPHTPWVINKFVSDAYAAFYRRPGQMWLVIGGNHASHIIELWGKFDMNASDATTFTHSAGGMKPVWQQGHAYATNNVAALFPDIHNWSFGFYAREEIANDQYGDMGSLGGTGKMAISARSSTGTFRYYGGAATQYTGTSPSSKGLWWQNRYKQGTSVGVASLWRNTVCVHAIEVASSGLPSTFTLAHASYWLWAFNTYSFFFCSPVNQPAGDTMYNLVQNLQTHLGRAV